MQGWPLSVNPGFPLPRTPFQTFWQAGYEGADHVYLAGIALSMNAGDQAKRIFVRATIAACDAIRAVDPRARFMACDPLINVVPGAGGSEEQAAALACHVSQFAAWDMLCGRLAPELGGAPHYLDLVGANFYPNNQWEVSASLSSLLGELQARYQRPIFLAETSHVGSGRGAWMRKVAQEAVTAMRNGVDLQGICLYPAIDRPDWNDLQAWHRSGLWEVSVTGPDPLERVLCEPYAEGLRQAQNLIQHFLLTNALHGQEGTSMPTIVVFSHLRWDFVYQRPQQLLSRLAQHYKILFIEEPIFTEKESHLHISSPAFNINVLQPHTCARAFGFHDDQIPLLRPLLADVVDENEQPIVWFYTPMALPLLNELHPSLVVYDCMDELAAFKNAPKQLLQREAALLKMADLVFTGGPSLYAAKRERTPHAHCFPSSVDVLHFEQALDRANAHPAHSGIPAPRLGYYGVIDERLDTALVAAVADAHPDWQIVLVGPVVKISPDDLPQRANIHYLGQQPYQALPQFLAGWDVCLMPFALNESTRFISPTKVLEYMAAQLPVVSTAITDVEKPYGHIVAIGHDSAEFIAHCEAALAITAEQRVTMSAIMQQIVACTSWDATVKAMHALISNTVPGQHSLRYSLEDEQPAVTEPASAPVNPLRATASIPFSPLIIIGGGPTGLSAAYHYGEGALLLEKNDTVGGWCRSIDDHGFTFDYAGHIMFSNDPYVLKLYEKLLGDNLHWQNREAWVYSKNVYTRYPFQGALYGLPPTVIKECILGAIDARYGVQEAANSAPACATESKPEDCCADGSVDLGANPARVATPPKQSFEDFIYKVWGSGIAKHFAIPYNKKIWTVPLSEMETSWLGGRVPLPDLGEIIEGALEPVGKPMGPNARFGYPLKGGFQALIEGFLPHITGKVETGAELVGLYPTEHVIALADGRRFSYDQLISTMPLPELIRLIGDEAPAGVRAAAEGLKHISIRCVNIGIGREKVTEKHWIYYPEDSIFHRIFVQGNASPHCNPPGGFGITCEISYSPWKPLPVDGDALIERCIADCIKVGLMNADDPIITANAVDMPYAYVVYDHQRADNVATVKNWLAQHDIVLSGRYSEWEYYNSDHAFVAGKKAAEHVLAARPGAAALQGSE